ncbi:hypothetical protein HOK68_00730 [Candidatus Woesearchaeota archaeon]|nr:hypothetical protein [Candidatus Woesearchaeota archaeon]MBT4595914.1 hypothetical protein [Candidatus Woesearchaeota archaeon]MBT5741044.1 hypothetical protein [Candidatus Woesearchaeota archaeon]MBT6505285.1 hypothetical protein [Candidatus Woesearchaeota archaeon]MBT7296450.1 hypothetical protein [Candidatus Woesearchaeota archaeon]
MLISNYDAFLKSLSELFELVSLESNIKTQPNLSYSKIKLNLIKNIYKFILNETKLLDKNCKLIINYFNKHKDDDELHNKLNSYSKKLNTSIFELKLHSNSFSSIINQLFEIEYIENEFIHDRDLNEKQYLIYLNSVNDILYIIDNILKQLMILSSKDCFSKISGSINMINESLKLINEKFMGLKLKIAVNHN